MKYKAIIRSIPIISLAIILMTKMLFPVFAKNQTAYLYLVSFLALVSIASAVICLFNTKLSASKLMLLGIALIGMIIIFYFQYYN